MALIEIPQSFVDAAERAMESAVKKALDAGYQRGLETAIQLAEDYGELPASDVAEALRRFFLAKP
jgi:hypothetical protein